MDTQALSDKTAGDYMEGLSAVVGPEHHLVDAAQAMARHRAGSVIVLDPALPGPGLLSERDLALAIAAGADPQSATVGEWMRHDVASISPDTSLDRAARTMLRQGVRHCLVMDGEGPVGIVSLRYLIGLVLEEDSQLPPADVGSPPGG